MPTDASTWQEFWDAWELFREPIACAVAAGAVLGFLGVYIVVRRMVFVSVAVTQAAGLGVAFALYAQIHLGLALEPVLGAVLAALLAALLFSFDPERKGIARDSVLGLTFALSGGAAVLVGERIAQEAHDIQAILFGTAVLVRRLDLLAVLVLGALLTLLHAAWVRGFTFATCDPVTARVQGLPVRMLDALLLLSIGAMVGVSTRALGALPVFAFSVLPAMSVLVLGVRMPLAFAAAALVGAACGFAGYLAAFFFQFPVGGSQTVVASALALVALLLGSAFPRR